MSHHRTNYVPYVIAFAAAIGCATLATRGPVPPARSDAKRPERAAMPPSVDASVAPTPRRVILVSVDGLHAKLTDRMPVWQEFVRDGSWTLKARVPKGATTVISHAALYTGADPQVNGVTRELENKNGLTHVHGWRFRWKPFMKVASDGTVTYTVKDTLFTAVEAAGYKATAVVQKGKLVGMLRPDGDETDIHVYADAGLIKAACKAVQDDDVRLVILHIGSPDGAGHEHGWLSDEQYAAAEKVSDQLRAIRDCAADAEKAGGIATTLIVTSDHGGTPVDVCMKRRGKPTCGHGANDDDNRLVPWVAVGSGVKAGHEIAASVELVDTAPTILRLLDIPLSSIPTLSGAPIDEILATQ